MFQNKQLIKWLFVIFLVITCSAIYAQNIGIGTNAPDASSKLDISSANSGLLIPRVSLVSVMNGASPISSPATSLLVYNSNASVTGGSGAGYYFWNGTQWERLFSGAFSPNWSLTGNSGTSAATNFIGTTDAVDFVTKTNNLERMRVTSGGFVGIGLTPSYKLDLIYSSAINEDRAVNINFSTSATSPPGPSPVNSALYITSTASSSGDLYGVWSIATPSSTGRASAVAGIVNSIGFGDRIVVASQLAGSGDDGAGLSAGISGNWTNAYGLYVDNTAGASQKTYGIYVTGTPDYSGFMQSGNFYVNDNVAIGLNADPPQAKLHVDGNIKSNSLVGVPIKRILYTDNNGEIKPLTNGNPGDVLMIDVSGLPVWSSYSGSQVFMSRLETPESYNSLSPTLVFSKTITPVNDTVIVEFNLNGEVSSGSGTVSPLTSFEVTLEVNGIVVNRAFGNPNSNATGNHINISFSVPVECVPASLIEVYIQRYSGPNITISVDPLDFTDPQNATMTIHDVSTNNY